MLYLGKKLKLVTDQGQDLIVSGSRLCLLR
jgi:hypothetical protein